MSESQDNSQQACDIKPPRLPRAAFVLAGVTLVFVIVRLCIFGVSWILPQVVGLGSLPVAPVVTLVVSYVILLMCLVAAIAALIVTRKGTRCDRRWARRAAALNTATILVIFGALLAGYRVGAGVVVCQVVILDSLDHCLATYAKDHGDYPAPEKWCDLLVDRGIPPKVFVCPIHKDQGCSYAINPHCKPDSPPDTVLLFESDGGWNAHGGPELLNFDNHAGYGANVLLNNGDLPGDNLRFVPPEDVNDLLWNPEETADD